jgi:diguanylate cyclase (GGDEF)-like protein/PAS domain S-box-containing protein
VDLPTSAAPDGVDRPSVELTLDALDSPIAVLDGDGTIVSVNDAWDAAARSGGAPAAKTSVGVNYLTICDTAVGPGSQEAPLVAAGIREVLSGEREWFALDYPCPSPSASRWFTVRVSSLGVDQAGAVVIHHDITALRLAEVQARADDSRLRRAFDETSPVFVLLEPDGTIATIAERTCALLGLERSEVVGRNGFDFIEPADLDRGQHALASVLTVAGSRTRVECRVLDGSGRRRVMDLSVVNMLDEPGVRAVAVTGSDVTDTRLHQIADRLERRLLQQLPAAVVAVDDHGGIVYWNQRAEVLLQVRRQEALGRRLLEIGVGARDPQVFDEIAGIARAVGRWEGSLDVFLRDSTFVPLHTVVERVDDDESGFHGVVTASIDVSERRMLEHELAFQALHDPLTGLPNRRRFVERLEESLTSGTSRAAVAFIDLDDFKELNDRVGHLSGDQALREIADRLAMVLRSEDVVARFGGDEFVVGMSRVVDAADALAVAGRILHAVRQPLDIDGTTVHLSATIGVALAQRDLGAEVLIRNADAAMYEAKERGKDRIALFDDGLQERRKERRASAERLRAAVRAGHIHAYFQPQRCLRTGRLIGFEALARWEGDEPEFQRTAHFLAAAEEGGVVSEIDRLVLEETCATLARFQQERPDLGCTISTNVSAELLADPAFPTFVDRVLQRTGVPPSLLCIEVVESALADPDAVAENLGRLERAGVEVAIDDFGTGYSSLSRIQQFHVDYLKIDRSFVAALGTDREQHAVVGAIIGLGHALGLRTIAEGVETEDQVRLLRRLGVDIGQGFLWSPAVPPDAALAMVREAPPAGLGDPESADGAGYVDC